jgi:Transposase DNA-binding
VYPLEKDFRCKLGLAADAGRSVLSPADGLEAETWAEKELGGAPLGDARLSKRLVNVAHAKADTPGRAFGRRRLPPRSNPMRASAARIRRRKATQYRRNWYCSVA